MGFFFFDIWREFDINSGGQRIERLIVWREDNLISDTELYQLQIFFLSQRKRTGLNLLYGYLA